MTASTSSHTFYATPTHQVTQRIIMPGEALHYPISAGHGLWMPITPGLVSGTDALKPGHYIKWDTTSPLTAVTNTSTGPVEVLELVWGSIPNEQQKPLHEITETRPWGSFTVLSDAPHFKLKQLWVEPGQRLSLQRHEKREEHWFVTAGKPTIVLNDDTLNPPIGKHIHIPFQAWHRLSNDVQNTEGVEIIELQLGSYFGEDDIERKNDDYGRQ